MPTIMCVCMPIGRVYFKARAVKKDSVPDIIKIELTYVPIKGGIVYSDVNRFFYSPGQALVLPPYDVEIVWCGIVSSLKPVCMDGSGFLQVFPAYLPHGPGCFPYVFFITCNFPTLVTVDNITLLVLRVLVLGFTLFKV